MGTNTDDSCSLFWGGVVGALGGAYFQYRANRPKIRAEAEKTLGDGWEKFASTQSKRMDALEKRYDVIKEKRSYWIPGSWHLRLSYTDDISSSNP